MTVFDPKDCAICGAKPGLAHDQAAHDRRKAEDWQSRKLERPEIPKEGIYDPPGDRQLPPYVRSLIEKRPDMKAEILAEYEAGLAGERLPEPQIPLPLKKSDDLELQPPRKVFGYDPTE